MYFKMDSLEWIFYVTIKTVQSLQSPTKVLALLSTFPVSFKAIYQFVPLPPIQYCLSWWSCHCSFPTLSGERGFLIPVMPLDIVSKIACQRMFQLSDPGVPRTFVEDCSFYMQKWIRFKMVSHERQAAYKQKWRMEDVLWRKNAIVLSLVS